VKLVPKHQKMEPRTKPAIPSAAAPTKRTPFLSKAIPSVKASWWKTIQVSGTIRGVREATITSETQGRITQDNVVLGQVIDQDTVLVAVDSEIAEISLNQMQSQYANAQLDFQSAQTLFSSGSISRAELNRSQANLNGAKAAYQRALKAFQDTRITAPFSGYISTKDPAIGVGNFLSPGRPVARVVDLSTLKMILSVGESDVSFLNPGYPAQIVIPSIEKTYEGTVTEVAAGADPSTGSFQFNVEFENPETNGIRSGLSATAIIQVNGQSQQLILPSFALIGRGEITFVYRYEDGRAVRTPVRVISKRANRMIVESDLGPGDVVITSGLTALGRRAFGGCHHPGRIRSPAMSLGKFSVSNPVLVNILMFVIFILGWLSISRLPQEQFSEVPFYWVNVIVPYPGVSAEDVEKTVTVPIENEYANLEKMSRISSVSSEGLSVVRIEFEDGINDEDFNRLYQKVQTDFSRITLPDGVLDATIDDFLRYRFCTCDRGYPLRGQRFRFPLSDRQLAP
jgi:RND family efflux transporter MFP subunit